MRATILKCTEHNGLAALRVGFGPTSWHSPWGSFSDLPHASGLVSVTQEPTGQVLHPHSPFTSLLVLETGEARNPGGGSDQKKNSDRQRQAHPSLQSQRGEHCPGLSEASGPQTQVRGSPLGTASMVIALLHSGTRNLCGASSSAQTSLDIRLQPDSQNVGPVCSSLCSCCFMGMLVLTSRGSETCSQIRPTACFCK